MKIILIALLLLNFRTSVVSKSNMEISELLGKHRETYLKFFVNQKSNCKGVSEALLEMKSDRKEEIYRLYRFDCLGKNEDGSFKIIEFNIDSFISHESFEFDFEGLQIELNPFFWNGCEIHFDAGEYNFDPYVDWAKKWIDINDESSKSTIVELAGLIHNVQPPDVSNGKYTLSIDFGTAQVASFLELLTIIQDIRVKQIEIDSKAMFEE